MKTIRRIRAMASLCREVAASHPDKSCRLLAEAEYWEHLAEAELFQPHFGIDWGAHDAVPTDRCE